MPQEGSTRRIHNKFWQIPLVIARLSLSDIKFEQEVIFLVPNLNKFTEVIKNDCCN